MTKTLLAFCARRSWLVLTLAFVAALAGFFARRSLPRDVIPDLADPRIAVVVDWMGHPAIEVSDRITRGFTQALAGDGVRDVRGQSMAGMAYLEVVLHRGASVEDAQSAVKARVESLRQGLPAGARVSVGPATTSTGWVFEYALIDPSRRESSVSLRRFQETVLKPKLARVAGVAEVATLGGTARSVIIEAKLEVLRSRAVAYESLTSAVGRWLEQHPTSTLEELKAVPVEEARVGELAFVRVEDDMPVGVADLDGAFETVGGVVVAARGADPSEVAERVKLALEAARPELPAGAKLVHVYDRSSLVERVDATLNGTLIEEVLVVGLVVLLFLLHGKSAIVPWLTLPLVMLATFGIMWLLGLPATLMSLGGLGIALGIAVDADVVALEACHRSIEQEPPGAVPEERRARLVQAASAFTPAILTSLLITALSFLPVLAFDRTTGRLLIPLAITKSLVIGVSAFVACTVGPALRDRLLRGKVGRELDNPVTRRLVALYRPFVHFALRRPYVTLGTAALCVLSCVPILGNLGGEFLPRVDEGDLLFMPTTLAGADVEQSVAAMRYQDMRFRELKEVATVFGKLGRAETPTDPAPLSMIETIVRLKPRESWPKLHRSRWYSSWAPAPLKRALGTLWPEETPRTQAELIEELDAKVRLPGWTNAWTAPARARMDMMSTGLRAPVGLRVVASTPDRLDALGSRARAILAELPETRTAAFEGLGGERRLELHFDPTAEATFGVDHDRAERVFIDFQSGGQVGELLQDGESLRVRVRPNLDGRGLADQARELTVSGAAGPVALGLLARASWTTTPSMLRTEAGELCAYVVVDLAPGVDIAAFVEHAKRRLGGAEGQGELQLEQGERLVWGGQWSLFKEGERRLVWILPLVALSMLGLLYLQFKSLAEAFIVLASVPFALVGSLWALRAAGFALSAPVWVGLLSVLGLAMQTGVVMVVYIDEAFHRRVREGRLTTREDIIRAHAEGTIQRLRPKIMTVSTMAAGLLPLLWKEGAGSEIMRRVAVPMLGGLGTSAFLTLEVIPVLYTLWRARQLAEATRRGVPIEVVSGPAPSWARLPGED